MARTSTGYGPDGGALIAQGWGGARKRPGGPARGEAPQPRRPLGRGRVSLRGGPLSRGAAPAWPAGAF
eukprot:360908-Alexandrium_andersonii.AAC.1